MTTAECVHPEAYLRLFGRDGAVRVGIICDWCAPPFETCEIAPVTIQDLVWHLRHLTGTP